MSFPFRTRVWLLLGAVLLAGPAFAQQGGLGDLLGGSSRLPGADEAASVTLAPGPHAVRPGAAVPVPVRFVCEPGTYVWHDSIKATPGEMPSGVTLAGVAPPAPKEKYDETLEQTVAYVDGTFDVLVTFHVSDAVPVGEHAVGFELAYTLCSPTMCKFGRAEREATLAVSPDAPPPAPPVEPEATPQAAMAETTPVDDPFAGHSPVVVVLLAFLLGLGLTLTPCIYPLIPVTIGVVGATSGARRLDGFIRSLVYVLGISITYSAVGVAAAATGGLFGQIAHSPAVYIALAVAFVLLAGGMFDLYTIDLSSQRLQRLQAALRGKAGLIGVLVIGMLSGAAATACIAPVIIAALGYVAASGSLLLGWVIFFAMAWGMGTPLVLVGTFAGLAQSLPKSGQWMVTVKHVLGVILLACAVWFVMKSGLFGGATPDAAVPPEGPRVAWVESTEEALALAESQGKPVLIDFWSETCAPCMRMFRTTYVDPPVVAESGRFVVAKINVDHLSDAQREHAGKAYGLRGVPTTVFIDTAGEVNVVTREIGPDEMLELLRATR